LSEDVDDDLTRKDGGFPQCVGAGMTTCVDGCDRDVTGS
jgi:hypothetical protein